MEFNEEHDLMLKDHSKRISDLEGFKLECDKQHEVNKEHRRRNDDAMNQLSNSNLTLAKVMADVSATVTKMDDTIKTVVDQMKGDRPIIDFWKSGRSAYDWAKLIAPAIGFMAVSVLVMAAIVKYL